MDGAWSPYPFQLFSLNYVYSWTCCYYIQIAPVILHNPCAFFNVSYPSQVPGYFPIGYFLISYDLFNSAQTNNQLLNNPGQLPDPDSTRAQQEIETGEIEYGYENDGSMYEDDESEYSVPELGEAEQLRVSDFISQYEHWPDTISTWDEDLLENILNFRDAHQSEFYSTDRGGLSEDIITENLKTRLVDKSVGDQDDMLCIVCQDCLFRREEKIATLDCGHEYHEECIKNWLMRKNSCPLCKATGIQVNVEENVHD